MSSRPIPAWTPPVLRAPMAPALAGDDEPTLTSWSPFSAPLPAAAAAFQPVTGPPPPPRPPPSLPPVPDDPDAEASAPRRPFEGGQVRSLPLRSTASWASPPGGDNEVDSDELEGADRTGTFQRPIRGAVSRVSPARMIVEIGPNVGATYALPAHGGALGRGTDCAIQLRSAQVSRRHALVQRVEADIFVEDVSHRNGLFLNQVRVHRARLLDGDLLQVGDVVLRFERG